jgi:hypothetical protein
MARDQLGIAEDEHEERTRDEAADVRPERDAAAVRADRTDAAARPQST